MTNEDLIEPASQLRKSIECSADAQIVQTNVRFLVQRLGGDAWGPHMDHPGSAALYLLALFIEKSQP